MLVCDELEKLLTQKEADAPCPECERQKALASERVRRSRERKKADGGANAS